MKKRKAISFIGALCVAAAFACLGFYTDAIRHDLIIFGIAVILFVLGFALMGDETKDNIPTCHSLEKYTHDVEIH